MSTLEMVSEYRATRERYDTAAFELHDQLVRMVFATLTGVLPGTESVEVIGADNEDLIPTPGPDASDQSKVLFDVDRGHPIRAVEDAVDLVEIEYFDVLIDITGNRYMRAVTISQRATAAGR